MAMFTIPVLFDTNLLRDIAYYCLGLDIHKMRKIIIVLFLIVTLPVLGGCFGKDNTGAKISENESPQSIPENSNREIILKEFRQWEGTPHKMGGNSKRGIDCSGFAHYMYGKLFNLNVPRSTRLFLKEGVRIKKSQLTPGDLVIFRPPTYPYHVGIYVGDNKFIHASTTKGVMMSDLNNPYWVKSYHMSRRIL
jgi:cell wall-associated NlpC family hydrolase